MGESIVAVERGRLVAADRDAVHAEGRFHFGVHLVARCGSRIFLQRRSSALAWNAGLWTSAVSGHIKATDATIDGGLAITPAAGAAALDRETREELGYWLPVRKARFVGHTLVFGAATTGVCRCMALIFALETDPLVLAECGEADDICSVDFAALFRAIARSEPLLSPGHGAMAFATDFPPVMREVFRRR